MIKAIPNFKGFYATKQGKEHLNNMSKNFVEKEVKPAIELAENSKYYDLSIEDDGKFYISSANSPKFTLKNLIISVFNNQIHYNALQKNGNEKATYVQIADKHNAGEIMNKAFPIGCSLPHANLELFKILENNPPQN